MDKFFDRLGDIVRTFMKEGAGTSRRSGPYSDYDPDMREAWDELNDYLNDEKPERDSSVERSSGELMAREHLRGDYANLEVPFGSPYEKVRSAYKKMLITYHPDRNADDPERLRVGTEITKKINVSFQRIKKFEEGRSK